MSLLSTFTMYSSNLSDWSLVLVFDQNAAPNWATAFMYSFLTLLSFLYANLARMCISIATFAYVGVEIVAASALEVQWPRRVKTDL